MTGTQAARPLINIIVACAANRVIGVNGKMPWHLPEDLKRFKALTMSHSIVMGRKTWESLGRLLPGRRHVIVSRNSNYAIPGATVVASLNEAMKNCLDEAEVFIIGGGEIYRLALTLADRLYITEIQAEYKGDTYFPELPREQWEETERTPVFESLHGLRYGFVTYERRKPTRLSIAAVTV